MVALIDEELEKLENNSEYLKLKMIRLERIMKNECVGDMERQPYKQEYNRIKKKLELLRENRRYS